MPSITGACCAILVSSALVLSIPAHGQEASPVVQSAAASPAEYENNTDGLRRLLQDMIAASRAGENAKLAAMIKETEIPNYEKWFVATFGQEKGESWAGPYGRNLHDQEGHFEQLINRLTGHSGGVSVEKLDTTKRYDTLTGPLDEYLADWVPARWEKDAETEHIGYFFFVDGKFRWDSTVVFIAISRLRGRWNAPSREVSKAQSESQRINNAAAPGSYPTCIYCPSPEYTKDALKAKFEGAVQLSVIVQADGTPTDAKVVKGSGFASLDQKSVETLMRWRFKPAVDRNGDPVPYLTAVSMSYHHF
jgi:TonB family protein